MVEIIVEIIVLGILVFIIGFLIYMLVSDYIEDKERAREALDRLLPSKLKDAETIPCETCKCLLKKEDAYKVKAFVKNYNSWEQYFCKKCQPKYEKVVYAPFGDDAPNRYYKMLEVDVNGKPIALRAKKC